MTGFELARASLLVLGIVSPGEGLSPDQSQQVLANIRRMIDTWRTQRLLCYVEETHDYLLVSGQQTYTFGPGGNFDTIRPVYIDRIGVVQHRGAQNELELPLYVERSGQSWQAVLNKETRSAWPIKVYIETDYPLAKLKYWPVMNGNVTLYTRIYTFVSITGLANLSTNYTFAPGYEEALVYNLAIRLAPEWGVAMPDIVRDLANSRMADVKRTNVPNDVMVLDPALPGRNRSRQWNYLTGQFNGF